MGQGAIVTDARPDTVIFNAQVLTVDVAGSAAQALAVKGNRVAAVGSSDHILRLAGPKTRRLDVGGRTVVPGFIDTHAHLDREGLRRAYPDLQACRSIADVQEVVRRAAAGTPPGEWIVLLPPGQPPYHMAPEQSLAERRFPNRHELDAVAPDNPVWIRSIWGLWNNTPPFVHVLNSAGVRACGITRHTPPPTSTVEIERDPATGELTGRILERHLWPAAEFTILRAAPRFTHEVRLRALSEAMRLSAATGTTSVFEGHGVAAELHKVYKEVHDAGEQTVRAYLPISLPPWQTLGEVEAMLADWAHYASVRGFGDEWLTIGGVYLEYGGHPEVAAATRAAWPYTGWAGFTEQCNDPDTYRALCRLAARHRLRVATIGLAATDAVLSTWESVAQEYPIHDLRWVLVHGREMEPARDYPRLARLGCVVTTQPSSYVHRSGLALARSGIDPERLMAHRDYIAAGVPWALSSDNKPYWLMFTLWVAVTRRAMGVDVVVGPGQRVSVPEALRALTWAGAYASFAEDRLGSLEVGKLADLLVLSDDLLRTSPEALKDVRVELTMIGGRIVHGEERF
jgi:predicted amidohydrolase YtcJ